MTGATASEPSGEDAPDQAVDADAEARAVAAYPGAVRPDRRRRVDAGGVGLAVAEWGDEDAPPLVMAHGGFDFTGTLDVFAPLLAAAGWRVVSWDQRGHGDSDHTHLYSVDADLRDARAVLDSVSSDPIPLIGHSKGGVLMLRLADALPHRVSHLVNLDGIPSARNAPDVPEHNRTRLLVSELDGWLGHRHRARTKIRRPGTIDELAQRRRQMNPRLPIEWLRYLVTRGARRDEDGWRWKLDPVLRFGGFGPWRPEWTSARLAGIGSPVLCVLGLEAEPLAWGTIPDDVKRFLPPDGRLVPLDATGHFVHIEKPQVVADLVLDFLPGRAPVTSVDELVTLRHVRIDLALHRLRDGDDGSRPLLLLHGLGEATPPYAPPVLDGWRGAVWGLDFTGHGASTMPVGGGYTAELLMADVDTALGHLGEVTILGRGLGAYIAVLAAGARATVVRGAILTDGPGLAGGGPTPPSALIRPVPPAPEPRRTPDPLAYVELTRDVRPADYAATYARLALQFSGLDAPLFVSAAVRPPWLEAVAAEPGVVSAPLADAIARAAAQP